MSNDESAAPDGSMPIQANDGSAKASSKKQIRFNQLIEKLKNQRKELAHWKAFRQDYQTRLAADYWPLAARVREKRGAIARLLDRVMDDRVFAKRERTKMREILLELLSDMLAETADPELVQLYDKYADVSFGEEQQIDLNLMRTVAAETYGIDVDAYDGPPSPDELAAWLAAQVKAARSKTNPPPRGKQSTKAVEGGSRAVRDVFRKLVSELHPDRETDPTENARKTEMMQTVNKAYEAGDLLGLLEVQLSIEQISPAALAGLARERMNHYIVVLEQQSRQLRDQLAEITAPFATAVGRPSSAKISPDKVLRTLAEDIRQLKDTLRGVEEDFEGFRDVLRLKRILKEYDLDR